MFRKLKFVILAFTVISCNVDEKKDFTEIKLNFIGEYSALFPDEIPLPTATSSITKGSFDYLSDLLIPTNSKLDSIKLFSQKFNAEIEAISPQVLTAEDSKDFNKIKNILKLVDTFLAGRESNPNTYNVLYNFQRILNSNFETPENRLQIIFNKLEKVPSFYEAAKLQLKKSEVIKADETIEMHLKTYEFFDEILPNYINAHHHMTPQYKARLESAKYAIKDYVAYVESLRLQ